MFQYGYMEDGHIHQKTEGDTLPRRLTPDEVQGLLSPAELIRDFFRKPVNEASLKWLWRQRRARNIPYLKLGKNVFFCLPAVQQALEKRNTIKAR
jgi:hypothetical protein